VPLCSGGLGEFAKPEMLEFASAPVTITAVTAVGAFSDAPSVTAPTAAPVASPRALPKVQPLEAPQGILKSEDGSPVPA